MTKGDLGLAFIVLAVVGAHAAYAFVFPLRRERRKTQRYPLFAMRHRMVMLVADGKLEEDDEVFQFLYESVNYLIPHAKHMGRWEIFRSIVKSPIVKLADDQFRTHLLDMLRHDDPEVRRVTRDFFGILVAKLARIWSVRIGAKLASVGLNACLNGLRRLERVFKGSDRNDALHLYYSLKESSEALAAA